MIKNVNNIDQKNKIINSFCVVGLNNDQLHYYSDKDKPNDLDSIHFIYHFYNPDGLYIWNKLGLKKPIYALNEIWNLMDDIKKEKKKDIDYKRESLELKLICLNEVKRFYKIEISTEDAKKNKIIYDEDLDEYNGSIIGCDHYFESAGESAWKLFGLENNFEPMSNFNKIEKEYEQKI